jgi:hypothetical protein
LITNIEKNYLYSIFLLLILCIAPHSNAQQVLWANKNNLDKRTEFTKVIGQNKYGVYVLKHKNSSFKRYFIIELFDKKMNLLKTKTFKIPGASLQKIVVHKTGLLYFTKSYGKGFTFSLKVNGIDSTFNDYPIANAVNSLDIGNQNIDFNVDYTIQRDKFLVWYLVDKNDSTSLNYHLFSTSKNLINGSINIPYKTTQIYIKDLCLDSLQNIYFVNSVSSKFKSKNPEDFQHYFLAHNIYNKSNFSYLINNEKTFINSYRINYNPSFHNIILTGLYGEKDEDENIGFFNIVLDCKTQKIQQSKFNVFDRSLIADIIGFKNEEKGENLSKFVIKRTIPRTDGGMLIIAERVFITTQSDIFYINGIPQSNYARIFNNDEVILLNIDSNLNVAWTDIIHKNQASVNDGAYYNSVITMVSDENVYILYNDKLSANSDIIQVTYDANGNKTQKILLNNEQYFALVIPAEYNQVSSNSAVLPIFLNHREFTYIKLIY